MASFSSTDVTADDYWWPSRYYPADRSEAILDRLLCQNFTVALNRQIKLVKSTSMRPSLSDTVLPSSDSSDKSDYVNKSSNKSLAKLPYTFAPSAIKPVFYPVRGHCHQSSRRRSAVKELRHPDSTKSRTRRSAIHSMSPKSSLQSVHCAEGLRYDTPERYMTKIGKMDQTVKTWRDTVTRETPANDKITYTHSRRDAKLNGPGKRNAIELENVCHNLHHPVLPPSEQIRDTSNPNRRPHHTFLYMGWETQTQLTYFPTYSPSLDEDSDDAAPNGAPGDTLLSIETHPQNSHLPTCHPSLGRTRNTSAANWTQHDSTQDSNRDMKTQQSQSCQILLDKSRNTSANSMTQNDFRQTHLSHHQSYDPSLDETTATSAPKETHSKTPNDPTRDRNEKNQNHLRQSPACHSSLGLISPEACVPSSVIRDTASVSGRKRAHAVDQSREDQTSAPAAEDSTQAIKKRKRVARRQC